jgi:hypothetical protein
MTINLTLSNQFTGIHAIRFIEKDLGCELVGITNIKTNRTTLQFMDTTFEKISTRKPFLHAKLMQICQNCVNKTKDLYSEHYLKVVSFSIMTDTVIV